MYVDRELGSLQVVLPCLDDTTRTDLLFACVIFRIVVSKLLFANLGHQLIKLAKLLIYDVITTLVKCTTERK